MSDQPTVPSSPIYTANRPLIPEVAFAWPDDDVREITQLVLARARTRDQAMAARRRRLVRGGLIITTAVGLVLLPALYIAIRLSWIG